MAFFGTAVESPLTATLKRPISSVPKVAVVKGFNCSHYPWRENCSILNTKGKENRPITDLHEHNYCYIPRLSLSKMGTAIGWFLVTWPWLKSNVSRSWYIRQCSPLGLHYSTWSKHGGKWRDRRREKYCQVLPVFFFVNEHNNPNTKPQAKKQRFFHLSQKFPEGKQQLVEEKEADNIRKVLSIWNL